MNARDSALIASLYLTEASHMRAFARRRLNDPDEADDLVNEAFRILSERQDLQEIRNPAAFLMTVLHRQVNSHLRQKYRRQIMSIEEARTDIPSSPDIADSYEEKERAALVAESVKDLPNPRQKRAVNLYSLNYKAGEIAAMETASGQPTTSHQISCVLQGGLANLKIQLRRRGFIPSFIPLPWFLRFRARVSAWSHQVADQLRLIEPAGALQIVLIASLTGIAGIPGPQTPASPREEPTPATGREVMTFHLQVASLNPDVVAEPEGISAVPIQQAVPAKSSDGEAPPAASQGTADPEIARTDQADVPRLAFYHQEPPPSTELSQDGDRADAYVEPVPGESSWLTVDISERRSEDPAPPIAEQTKELIEDPGGIPKPECGGLPPVCSGSGQDGSQRPPGG